MRVERGTIQFLNPEGQLKIVAHYGFDAEFLNRLDTVNPEAMPCCGRALRHRTTIAIEDIEATDEYRAERTIAWRGGYRATWSSPLIIPEGRAMGVLSTHFPEPHLFLDRSTWPLRKTSRFAHRVGVRLALLESGPR